MTPNDVITDIAINFVFQNTNFGGQPPREVVNTNLQQVADGYEIGRTAKICLTELGLVHQLERSMCYDVTPLGRFYLKVLGNEHS